MKQIVMNLLLTFVAVFGLSSTLLTVSAPTAGALTANQEAVCKSIGAGADCEKDTGGTDVNTTVMTVINILSSLVGVLAVIMIIVSGLKYVTAAGDSAKVTSAKQTLIYAIVGLVIVALAKVIVTFVLDKAT